MKNYVQPGGTLTVTAPAIVKSGGVVVLGSIIGIAATDGGLGDTIEVVTTGVFELAKATPLSIDAGDPVYWNDSSTKVTKTATDTPLGTATETAGTNAATVRVRLDPAALVAALAARVTTLESA
jgi:predicted RecA/RadA family phage recombinase